MGKMIRTINHFAGVIGYSREELLTVIDNIESYYYGYSEIKLQDGHPKMKNGVVQKRYFKPSKGELRDIQNKIYHKILNKISLPVNVKGGVKGCGNIEHAKLHKGRKYRFQTDLTNFFPSVSGDMVYRALRRKEFSKQVADMIVKLTTCCTPDSRDKTCIPQGAPTSPALANIVFEKTDIEILNLIKDKDIVYSRWLDDLTFSRHSEIPVLLINEILSLIGKNGFKISRKKTNCSINISTITGVDVGMGTMKVTKKFRNIDESTLSINQIKGRLAYKHRIYLLDKQKSTKGSSKK